jgi:uncharacterized protein YkwD
VVQPAAAAPAAGTDQHGRLVDLANAARAAEGLAPLAWNDLVAAAATAHSLDMAATESMNHAGSDGSDGGDRLTAQGFRWTAWGENIAAGFTETEPLFDAWMASSGHRRQILGDYRYIGLGVGTSPSGTHYWTLVVASA